MMGMIFLGVGFGSIYQPLFPALLPSIIIFTESLPQIFFPRTLFGRWKGSYVKEKLEWDAFKEYLYDIAMIQKYSPEDLNILKEWLV